MNISKTARIISDPTMKLDNEYFKTCLAKAKELINLVESRGRKELYFMHPNCITDYYTWNVGNQRIICKKMRIDKIQDYTEYTKTEAIDKIAVDLYNEIDWNFI